MSIYNRSDYRQFKSVNEWFTRELHPNVSVNLRPVAEPTNPDVLVSPADARLMVFPNTVRDSKVWIKGGDFSVSDLLNGHNISSLFLGGSMAIVRLAPQDYHRFHTPVTGKIVEEYFAEGTIFSVSADAMTSGNNAQLNQRVITLIDTGPDNFGNVAFVSVGATCVGSVYMFHRPQYVVNKGQPMGFFQFGGSTVILLFEPGKLKFDEDLVARSTRKVETLVRVGQRIGTKAS